MAVDLVTVYWQSFQFFHMERILWKQFSLTDLTGVSGMRFGLLQIKSFIYNVISNYRVLRCERTADKVVLDRFYIMPRNVDGLWIKLEKL